VTCGWAGKGQIGVNVTAVTNNEKKTNLLALSPLPSRSPEAKIQARGDIDEKGHNDAR